MGTGRPEACEEKGEEGEVPVRDAGGPIGHGGRSGVIQKKTDQCEWESFVGSQ